jgi:hypothetical protein
VYLDRRTFLGVCVSSITIEPIVSKSLFGQDKPYEHEFQRDWAEHLFGVPISRLTGPKFHRLSGARHEGDNLIFPDNELATVGDTWYDVHMDASKFRDSVDGYINLTDRFHLSEQLKKLPKVTQDIVNILKTSLHSAAAVDILLQVNGVAAAIDLTLITEEAIVDAVEYSRGIDQAKKAREEMTTNREGFMLHTVKRTNNQLEESLAFQWWKDGPTTRIWNGHYTCHCPKCTALA